MLEQAFSITLVSLGDLPSRVFDLIRRTSQDHLDSAEHNVICFFLVLRIVADADDAHYFSLLVWVLGFDS